MRIAKTISVKTPTRGTKKSAGFDFYTPNNMHAFDLGPGCSITIPSGIRAEIPRDCALIAFNKSGMAIKGLQVGACVVDEDYQGEIHLHVRNISSAPIAIAPGQKLVQFLLLPIYYDGVEVVEDDELHKTRTDRGEGGFGSTGN